MTGLAAIERAVRDVERAVSPLGAGLGRVEAGLVALGRASATAVPAVSRTAVALRDVGSTVAKIEKPAGLAAHEITNLGAQLTDIGVSLAGGQSPFLILAQQGTTVGAILGSRGLGSIIPAVGASIAELVNPTTIFLAAVTAAGYAAAYAFSSFGDQADDIETQLKRHAALVKDIQAAWGDAADGIDGYATKSAAELRVAASAQIEALRNQIGTLASDLANGFGTLEALGWTGKSRLRVAEEFAPFEAAIQRLREQAAAGRPDIEGFVRAIAEIADADPANTALRDVANQMFETARAARDVASRRDALQGFFDSVASGARSLANETAGAIDRLNDLLRIAPTVRARAEEAYRSGIASAKSAGERASVEASWLAFLDREAGQRMADTGGVPKSNPANDLRSDYGVPTKTATNAAEAARKRIEDVTDALARQTAALGLTAREQAQLDAVQRAGLKTFDRQAVSIMASAGALYDLQQQAKAAAAASDFFAGATYDALSGLILKGDSLNEVFSRLALSIADAALQASLLGSGPLAGLFGTSKASGGSGGLLSALFGGLFGGGATGGLFASGGYTGAGGRNEPAGIVHAGEYVFDAASVDRLGIGALDRLRAAARGGLSGYAAGGYVADGARHAPATISSPNAAAPAVVNITVDAPAGTAVDSTRQSRNNSGGTDVLVKLVDQRINRQLSNGATDGPMRARYGQRANRIVVT
ncbi:phage tail length tape measure family protein [Prosthecomicrobium pneumaticum]|uniref:Bacteriophage tail tape measure N-terminal domain-containing protein n=1 Tax=Prosthecomicrobium pneumaticum TaxID=81895 RepID=A0A7W9FPS7_9HYPH|nr:phage tail length tape measure family protein [Prosthecomicrobium pneumaticum]MBB5754630.1 hypothetical protein [Prosthecomicrobium pneumaticum]